MYATEVYYCTLVADVGVRRVSLVGEVALGEVVCSAD